MEKVLMLPRRGKITIEHPMKNGTSIRLGGNYSVLIKLMPTLPQLPEWL